MVTNVPRSIADRGRPIRWCDKLSGILLAIIPLGPTVLDEVALDPFPRLPQANYHPCQRPPVQSSECTAG